jgi:hypothetical protein
MSEALSKFIQRFEDKSYFDLCLLSSYLLLWLIVAYIGIAELISLFSNSRLGLFEALLFTQIDIFTFQRSGIEIFSNNSWRSVARDTFLTDFRYWYNIVLIGVWLLAFRLLISKPINTLIKNIDLTKVTLNLLNYIKTARENLKKTEGITTSPNYPSKSAPLEPTPDEKEYKKNSINEAKVDLQIPPIFTEETKERLKAIYYRVYVKCGQILALAFILLVAIAVGQDFLVRNGLNSFSYAILFFKGLNCLSGNSTLVCYATPYFLNSSMEKLYFELGLFFDNNLFLLSFIAIATTAYQINLKKEFAQKVT